MPYISTEDVKIKRNLIKKTFPKFKFSIRHRHHSAICVTILSGPIDFLNGSDGYETVNNFYIKEHYKEFPEKQDMLLKLKDIINNDNYTIVDDGDYGTIPKFYTNISIGNWEKSYQFKK